MSLIQQLQLLGERTLHRHLPHKDWNAFYKASLTPVRNGPYLVNSRHSKRSTISKKEGNPEHLLFKITWIQRLLSLSECSPYLKGTTVGQRFIKASFLNDLHILVMWINYTLAANKTGEQNRLLIELLLTFIIVSGRYFTLEVLVNLSGIKRQLFLPLSGISNKLNLQKKINNQLEWQENPTKYCINLIRKEQKKPKTQLQSSVKNKEFSWLTAFIKKIDLALDSSERKKDHHDSYYLALPITIRAIIQNRAKNNKDNTVKNLHLAYPQQNLLKNRDIKLPVNAMRFLVDEQGQLFAIENNYRVEHNKDVTQFTPVKGLPKDTKVKQVFVSNWNTFVLLEDCRLFARGDNTYGQLCFKKEDTCNQFSEIKGLPKDTKVKQVFVSNWNTFVLLEDGRLFAAGNNEFGQLSSGLWYYPDKFNKVVNLPKNAKIKQAFLSHCSAFFLLENGQLYGSGKNTKGQLGLTFWPYYNRLTAVRGLPKITQIKQVIVSDCNTYILLENNQLYGAGDNKNKQLGSKYAKNVSQFVLIQGKEETKIRSQYKFQSKNSLNLTSCSHIGFQKITTALGAIWALIAMDENGRFYNIEM